MLRSNVLRVLAMVLAAAPAATQATKPLQSTFAKVDSLPGVAKMEEEQWAGYLPGTADGRVQLFFWLFEARQAPENAPLVLWLNGGPGVSSMVGVFYELGPYRVPADTAPGKRPDLEAAPAPWNESAHVLYVDQPAKVGLSYIEGQDTAALQVDSGARVTDQLYHALCAYFDARPGDLEREFYVFGESFGGNYAPRLADKILDENEAGGTQIRLAGVGLGNAWVDPVAHVGSQPDFLLAARKITEAQRDRFNKTAESICKEIDGVAFPVEASLRRSGGPTAQQALARATGLERELTEAAHCSARNINEEPSSDSFEAPSPWLNDAAVQAALHVLVDTGKGGPRVSYPVWSSVSSVVGDLLAADETRPTTELVADLLGRGVRVLVYSGALDLDVNVLGTDRWLGKLRLPSGWTLPDERAAWDLGGADGLRWRHCGGTAARPGLTQVVFPDAGHLVPMDAPARSRVMLDWFVGLRAN